MYALSNCKIYTGSDVLTDHAVIIENDLIQSIVPVAELHWHLRHSPINTRCAWRIPQKLLDK